MARALILCLMLAGCSQTVQGGGCMVYGDQRVEMPAPPTDPPAFVRWFNETDAGMLATCR